MSVLKTTSLWFVKYRQGGAITETHVAAASAKAAILAVEMKESQRAPGKLMGAVQIERIDCIGAVILP